MKLAVVAYPFLHPDDSNWIESSRSANDPAASRIRAHFTLVFPVEAETEELERELEALSRTLAPVDFEIARVEVHVVDSLAYVFLVPDDGFAEIGRLHDDLHAGVLRPHRRSDSAFVPHITVGVHADIVAAERQAEALRAGWRAVRGQLRTLDLVCLDSRCVLSRGEHVLGTRLKE